MPPNVQFMIKFDRFKVTRDHSGKIETTITTVVGTVIIGFLFLPKHVPILTMLVVYLYIAFIVIGCTIYHYWKVHHTVVQYSKLFSVNLNL